MVENTWEILNGAPGLFDNYWFLVHLVHHKWNAIGAYHMCQTLEPITCKTPSSETITGKNSLRVTLLQ